MIPQIIVLLFLLSASGFFSGSETAFFSLNQIEKEKLVAGTKGRRRSFLRAIIDSPAEILITILTGNMVVNLFFASFMDVVVGHYIQHEYAWLYSIFIGTGLVLIFGEMTPKNVAIRRSFSFIRLSSRPLRGLHSVLTPIRYVLIRIERGIMSFLSGRLNPESEDSRILISSTVQIGLKKGIVHHSELSILESFLDFREKTAEDVMIPRTEIEAIEVKTSIRSLLEIAKQSPQTQLVPVYRDDVDHIEGYVNTRDLLPYRHGLNGTGSISALVKPIHPIPESKNLMELLREIMQDNCEMALVVDEYGGTAGIVTYQHLVEDFLYFFYPSKVEHTKIDENTYRFPGSYETERVAQLLEIKLESDSRTVSGFVTETLEEIPAVGRSFAIDDLLFVVRAVSREKVLEVEVRKTS